MDGLGDGQHVGHHHQHRSRRISDIGGTPGHSHEGHYQLVNYSHYKSSALSPYIIYISVE